MSTQRILIALGAFAVVFGVVFVDWRLDVPLASVALLTALAALALHEAYLLLARLSIPSWPVVGVTGLVALFLGRALLPLAGLDPGRTDALLAVLAAALVVVPLLVDMVRPGAKDRGGGEEFRRAAGTALGLLLVWYLLSFLLELLLIPDTPALDRRGLRLTLILVLAVKVGDSTAYLVGRTIGRTRLVWVSPKKTWEGAVGGLLGSVAVGAVLGPLFGLPILPGALFAAVAGVAGQFGDLLESLVKRRAGVKDSGALLREMGGFFDTLDSLLLAAPAGYLFARLVLV